MNCFSDGADCKVLWTARTGQVAGRNDVNDSEQKPIGERIRIDRVAQTSVALLALSMAPEPGNRSLLLAHRMLTKTICVFEDIDPESTSRRVLAHGLVTMN